jgi:hypothetical protein
MREYVIGGCRNTNTRLVMEVADVGPVTYQSGDVILTSATGLIGRKATPPLTQRNPTRVEITTHSFAGPVVPEDRIGRDISADLDTNLQTRLTICRLDGTIIRCTLGELPAVLREEVAACG